MASISSLLLALVFLVGLTNAAITITQAVNTELDNDAWNEGPTVMMFHKFSCQSSCTIDAGDPTNPATSCNAYSWDEDTKVCVRGYYDVNAVTGASGTTWRFLMKA